MIDFLKPLLIWKGLNREENVAKELPWGYEHKWKRMPPVLKSVSRFLLGILKWRSVLDHLGGPKQPRIPLPEGLGRM